MSEFEKRIKNKRLISKVRSAEDCIDFFKDGMDLGWSGFTPVGYPKKVPICLANYVEQNNLQGKLKFNIFHGAHVGPETEDRWASLGMVNGVYPYQCGPNMNKGVNSGHIDYADKHLSMFPQDLQYGFYTKHKNGYGKLDIGLIEASEITNDGIILHGSVAAAPEIINIAEKLIIEINITTPTFYGMHDIVIPNIPPHREPYLIRKVNDRIGTLFVPVDFDKIEAIVESDIPNNNPPFREPDEASKFIGQYIIDFLEFEIKMGRMPKNLLPLQSGVGNITNAVFSGFIHSKFDHLQMYTELIQDSALDLIDAGKLEDVSCTALTLSPRGFDRLFDKFDLYSKKIVLRPQQISNNPELIRRLGVIGMNTPLEFDIYGHTNSTHRFGVRVENGIGGSGDFERNAYLSIMHTYSTRPTKSDPLGITCVVPKVSHVDHTEHDLDILVTEQGLADLRGLPPSKRAREIINKCAHPAYKDYLLDYLERAEKDLWRKFMGHEPQLLKEENNLYISLLEKDTMRFWK
jgi:acetyl-CoA hydrolase